VLVCDQAFVWINLSAQALLGVKENKEE